MFSAALVPQSLTALTEIEPLDVPAVTFIEVDVLLPVHPEGRVH